MSASKAAFPSTRRTAAIAVAAALALTATVPSVASAGSAPLGKGPVVANGTMTDISARRRGFNPGAAAVAGVVGTGLAIAGAAAASRAYAYDGYGPYGYYDAPGPVYVAPSPYYYGGYGPEQSQTPYVNPNAGYW